jgi:phosphoenolpyruvate carboxykinase (GTP)
MRNNPALASEVDDPAGVPISAIIFGGRRASTVPLIFQAYEWGHGVYVGATMASEMTAAAAGSLGQLRRDPMAMLPFCGYNMGDYFRHWLDMRRRIAHPPRVFHVNWFRKDAAGQFIWPGFGENMRILKWVVDRCHARAGGEESPIGWLPRVEDIVLDGLADFGPERFEEAQRIDPEEWKQEVISQDELFVKLHATMPKELVFHKELLLSRL